MNGFLPNSDSENSNNFLEEDLPNNAKELQNEPTTESKSQKKNGFLSKNAEFLSKNAEFFSKNAEFLPKNVEFLSKNTDFLSKNTDFDEPSPAFKNGESSPRYENHATNLISIESSDSEPPEPKNKPSIREDFEDVSLFSLFSPSFIEFLQVGLLLHEGLLQAL